MSMAAHRQQTLSLEGLETNIPLSPPPHRLHPAVGTLVSRAGILGLFMAPTSSGGVWPVTLYRRCRVGMVGAAVGSGGRAAMGVQDTCIYSRAKICGG